MKTKRQELGEVLKTHREIRRLSVRDVADRVGVSVGLVEQWERGDAVPDASRWTRLVGQVHRDLHRYRTLYTEASAERAGATAVATNLGEKLRAAGAGGAPVLAVVPAPPAPEDKTHDHGRPEGWRHRHRRAEREARARELFRANPDAYLHEVNAALRTEYGVGVTSEYLAEIRDEERLQHQRSSAPAPVAEPAAPPPPKAPSVDEQLAAATHMILETVPDLRSFRLEVDDAGEVQLSYERRASGSIKIKRL